MKPEIENLKAWMCGKSTIGYQRALAMREFEQLLTYVAELEQLRQPLVISSVCDCEHDYFIADSINNIWQCRKCRQTGQKQTVL